MGRLWGLLAWIYTVLFYPRAIVLLQSGRKVRLLQKIAEGGYADVLLAQQVVPNIQQEFAIKRVKCDSERLAAARQEIAVMQWVSHPCLLPLLDHAFIDHPIGSNGCHDSCSHTAYLLTPIYPDGTLAEELERLEKLRPGSGSSLSPLMSTKDTLHIFKQLCMGMESMHSKGWAHRDVKPHNVLIQKPCQSPVAPVPVIRHIKAKSKCVQAGAGPAKGSSGRAAVLISDQDVEQPEDPLLSSHGYCVVLTDFGSARPRYVELSSRKAALELAEDAEAHCTATYRAPELWDPTPGTWLDQAAGDVWSAGCLLFACMYGASPAQLSLNAGGSIRLAVLNSYIPWPTETSATYSPVLQDLVTRCLALSPADRPTAAQLVAEVSALSGHPSLRDPSSLAADRKC